MIKKQIESFLEGINYKYYALYRFDVNAIDRNEKGLFSLDSEPISIKDFHAYSGFRPLHFIASYPQEWMDYYFAKQYHKIDPLFEKGKNGFIPFRWGEGITFQGQLDTPERVELFEDAKEYGIYQGISVPLGTSDDMKALFTLTFGKDVKIDNTEFIILAMHLTHLGNLLCYIQDKHDKNEPMKQEDYIEICKFLSDTHHACRTLF